MTVALVTTITRYIGVAADDKPLAPRAGSMFYETDTGATYVFSDGAWELAINGGA